MVVDAPQDHIHRFESADGFEPHPSVAHGEVGAFDQRVIEVVGEIQVFEVGFVERPRRHDDHTRVFPVRRRQVRQGLTQQAEERGEPVRVRIAEQAGYQAGHHRTVFQRVAGAGGCLGAVIEYPDAAIGRTRQIGRVQDQPRRRHAGG